MKSENEVMKAANKSQSRGGRVRAASFEDFTPDHSLSVPGRAAQFLDWAADQMPQRFVPYAWIAKYAFILPKLPKAESDDVTHIKNKMGSIKVVLRDKYRRKSFPAPRGQEPGVRATIDSDDMAGTVYMAKKRRAASALRELHDTRSLIDTCAMHDPSLKSMMTKDDAVVKKLTDPTLMERLKALPPRREDGDD